MDDVKQYLYDTFVEEFNINPSFLLARTFYLFCHYNPSFDLPRNVQKKFIDGLLEDEVRGFCLRYKIKSKESSGPESLEETGIGDFESSLQEMKKEIYQEIAAENLSKGTGKTYSPSMVNKITTKYRSILSYNEILEIFIMSGR